MKPSAPNPSGKPLAERYFYSISTVILLVLTIIGFQLFYFHGMAYPGHPLPPPIKTLIIVHGIAMSCWMLLSVTQPFLIASGNRRIHMTLGKIAAVIAAGLVVLGFTMGIAATRTAPPDLMYGPFTPKQFMAVPVLDIVLFAIFVSTGVVCRKRPEIHKPMMFMASLAAVTAAISRIDFFNHLYAGTIWQRLFGALFFSVVIAAVFFIAKCLVFRKFDRWFATAFGMLTVWYFMIAQIMGTPIWDKIASALLRL